MSWEYLTNQPTSEVIFSLEKLQHQGRWGISQFKSSFPVPEGPLFVVLGKLGLPRNLFEKRVSLGSFQGAVLVTLGLLDSFLVRLDGHISFPSKASSMRQNLAWILSGYQRIWSVVSIWLQGTSMDKVDSKVEICSRFLASIRACCLCETSSEIETVYDSLQMLGDILSSDCLSHSTSLQSQLACFIDDFVNFSDCTEKQLKYIRRILPPLSDAMRKTTFKSLGTHLKVENLQQFKTSANEANQE